MFSQTPLTGFRYKPKHLSAYLHAGGMFVLYLRNKRMVQYETEEPERLLRWLKRHDIRDVNQPSTVIKDLQRKLKRNFS